MAALSLAIAASLAAPVRLASLDLCGDEYLLALARPGEIASVSRLAADPADNRFWRAARGLPANRGTLEDVIARRPTAMLSFGGGGKATRLVAARLGVASVALRYPASLDDVAANLDAVALALGDPARARPLTRALARLRATAPAPRDAAFLSGRGQSLSPTGLAAQWLALAGYRQVALPGQRLSHERLLTAPPPLLVRSAYRVGQASRGSAWLDHPAVRRLADRTIVTDGRPWTCLGPAMIGEVERLRAVRR